MNMHVLPAAPAERSAYTHALKASLADKVFFADRLPDDVNLFVDFGCADGAVLWATMVGRFGRPGAGDVRYVGFDRDPEMIREAEITTRFDPAFTLTSSWADVTAIVEKHTGKSCLVLSSVVHEVLSQGVAFEAFWSMVRELGCDYVVFRDMALDVSSTNLPMPDHWRRALESRFEDDWALTCKVASFAEPSAKWSRQDAIHFLLKAIHPDEDWEKELAENYLPLSATAYLNRMTIGSGYSLAHFEHGTLPALRQRWVEEFGIYVADNTHVKMILRKAA